MRAAALAALLLAAGCGYQTDRAQPQAAGLSQGTTQFVVVAREERKAQLLKEFLDAAMEEAGLKQRVAGIALRLNIATQELGIRRDETPSRARLSATVQYIATQRTPPGVEVPPLRGTVRVTDGYNFIDSEFFATDSSREAAERRMMQAAAGQIARRLQFAPQTTPTMEPAPAPGENFSRPGASGLGETLPVR